MPYIKDEEKVTFEETIHKLSTFITNKGHLNYAICELVGILIVQTGVSYTNMSEKIDTVHDAENELRRRLLNPYEDLKIKENGDVPSFQHILQIIVEGELGDQNGN